VADGGVLAILFAEEQAPVHLGQNQMLFPLNRTILPAQRRRSPMKAQIRGSTPTDEATKKSRTSQPQDQGSPDFT
jgi:hypothetical protein